MSINSKYQTFEQRQLRNEIELLSKRQSDVLQRIREYNLKYRRITDKKKTLIGRLWNLHKIIYSTRGNGHAKKTK